MKKLLLRIVLFFSSLALALGVDALLREYVPSPIRKGIIFWIIITVSFTLYRYLIERYAAHPEVRPLHFPRVLIVTTVIAIAIGLISSTF